MAKTELQREAEVHYETWMARRGQAVMGDEKKPMIIDTEALDNTLTKVDAEMDKLLEEFREWLDKRVGITDLLMMDVEKVAGQDVPDLIRRRREALRKESDFRIRRFLDEEILMLTWALWGIGERKVKAREWLLDRCRVKIE